MAEAAMAPEAAAPQQKERGAGNAPKLAPFQATASEQQEAAGARDHGDFDNWGTWKRAPATSSEMDGKRKLQKLEEEEGSDDDAGSKRRGVMMMPGERKLLIRGNKLVMHN